MYNIRKSGRFKIDYKKFIHNEVIKFELRLVLTLLSNGKKIPEKYGDHALKGNYAGSRECHIKPDICWYTKLIIMN